MATTPHDSGAIERLARLVHDSPIATIATDPRQHDNPIIVCNDAFCSLTGYPREETLGRNCRFLAGPATEPGLSAQIGRAVHERKPVLLELLNYRRDGTPFRNAVLVAPIYDGDGDLAFFLGSQIEVDEGANGLASTRRRRAAELVRGLSPRQWQVLKLVATGLLNKQIAAELGLSEKTVKMHRAILMDRLGAPTTADMIRIAVEAGL